MRANKKDRIARINRVERILYQYPEGLTVKELSEKCEVGTRTIRRDLDALDKEIGTPIWNKKGRWGIMPGHFLPPISFNLQETMSFFLAARLLLSYSNVYDPNIASAFEKLSAVVPQPLRNQVAKTIDWMHKLQPDDRFQKVMHTLTNAWANGRKVKIWYQSLNSKAATERVVDPYFIQPASVEHATYLIAYCRKSKEVRTFKVERITSIELLNERYETPQDFDANQYLGPAWGITVEGKPELVKLKFDQEVGRIAQETRWHPSQTTRMQADGSAVVTFKVQITQEFISFILGWGEKVEALEPERLRGEVKRVVAKMGRMYGN